MPWSGRAFLVWFDAYVTTPEAGRMVRIVAARHDVSGLADDLRQRWYESIRNTVDRRDGAPATLPEWLDHEEAAIRYAVRALHNDAIDLVRVQRRTAERHVSIEPWDSTPVAIADLRARPDVVAEAGIAIESIRREINERSRAGALGSVQCGNARVASLALAVVERLTGLHLSAADEPTVTGGADEWDRVVYGALTLLDPERFTPVDGRMSAAARKLKERCGGRVREVLRELFAAHFPDRVWEGR